MSEQKTLETLMVEIAEWQAVAFPDSHIDGYIEHLAEEVAELKADPRDIEKMADIFILWAGIIAVQGVRDEIAAAIERKLEINRARTWGRVQPNGIIKHLP